MTKIEKEDNHTHWYDRGITYGLYALIVLVPTVFLPSFHTVFSMPKLLILRYITLLIITLWGCKIFVEDTFSYKKSPVNIAIIIYGAISILTTILSTAFYSSLYGAEGRFLGIITTINFLLLPLIVFNFINKKQLRNFIIVSVLTASVLAVYGLLQYFGIGQDGFNWSQTPATRVFGTIGHANHFGAYLGMHIAAGLFIVFLLKKEKKISSKILQGSVIGGIFLQTIVLFLTGSRGAIVAVIISLLVTLIIAGYRSRKKIQKWLGYFVGALVVMALCMVIFWPSFSKIPFIERTSETVKFIQEGNVPDRISWWESTWEMIKNRPLLGYGLSTYRDIYNGFRRTDYKVPGPGNMENFITPEAAHNEYLNIAATQGIMGLIAFLIIIFLVFWKMDKVFFFSNLDEDFYMYLSVKGALLVHLFQVFVSFGVITTLTFFYFFVGAGMLLGQNSERMLKEQIVCRGVIKYVVSILIMGIVCSGAYFTFLEGRADFYYKQAETAGNAGQLESAIESYQRTLLDKPFEYAYFQAFGDFSLKSAGFEHLTDDVRIKLLKLAIVNYQNGININAHHPSTFYNLGIAELQLYMVDGDESFYKTATENFNKAVALAVNNALYSQQVEKVLKDCTQVGYCVPPTEEK